MCKIFNAKAMLIGSLYDAQQAIVNGQVKTGYNILKKKLDEIEKIEKCPYLKMEW